MVVCALGLQKYGVDMAVGPFCGVGWLLSLDNCRYRFAIPDHILHPQTYFAFPANKHTSSGNPIFEGIPDKHTKGLRSSYPSF
jgi:hypothetical protein